VRARLVELAEKNAATAATARKGKDDDTEASLKKLQERLSLKRMPRRIECYDIAHIQGTETVASMVTFVDGVAARSLYRKFKIRSVENNDFASMYEVLSRRFKRADKGDTAWARPDLVVIDGGKGQLASAVAALEDLKVPLLGDDALDIVGLAKERDLTSGTAPDRVYLRNVKEPIQLRPNSTELFVLARIRDEAHRFANTFHQDRRSKSSLRSQLDDVPGIGETRRKALLRHFGSVKAVREATVEQLAAAPGMTRKAAEAVARHLAAPEPAAPPAGLAPAAE
jgi:excinuclease ABC subunit C